MSRHVAVLKGGWSAEREVSLVSGSTCAEALRSCGYTVSEIDVHEDLPALLAALADPRPDVVFNALHGRGGEDGTIQAILDILKLPYTHSSLLASAVAMDKPLTKRLVAGAGVQVPESLIVSREAFLRGDPIDRPYVVKPLNEGSSVGVAIIRDGDNQVPFAGVEWPYGAHVLVEPYISGRDLTIGVMSDRDGDHRAMTVTEIRPMTDFYDYQAKYTAGKSVHICPAELPQEVFVTAQEIAVVAHRTLGCSGVTRTDLRWDDSKPGTEGLYFLEINTQPGMTPLSLVPEQASHLGMSFTELVTWIVEHARCPA